MSQEARLVIAMKRGQKLHDRATRGLPLSDGERAELDRWYAQMNAEEAKLLRIPAPSHQKEVQNQIELALHQIQETAQQILQVRAENRDLREQISELQKEFLHTRVPTP